MLSLSVFLESLFRKSIGQIGQIAEKPHAIRGRTKKSNRAVIGQINRADGKR